MENKRQAVFDLFLASALSLFVELMLVRWVATEERIFSFYKNFALIAAFLGLGIGFALRRRTATDIYNRQFFALLTVLTLLVLVLGRTKLNVLTLLNTPGAQEWLWVPFARVDRTLVARLLFYAATFSTMSLLTMTFIPLGHLTASKFTPFEPLPGYTINVAGSLVGILLFTLASWLGAPPPVWFLLAGAASFYFLLSAPRRQLAMAGGLVVVQILLTALWPTGSDRTIWSPYYSIGINTFTAESDPSLQLGYKLKANQIWHQNIWDLSEDFVEDNYEAAPGHFTPLVTDYNMPFELADSVERVLIVGAGAGNDVAAALRAGAVEITAVEIDPMFFRLGRELHPEAPYSDPRVSTVTQDARSFFRRDDSTYDLIVFGRVDSQTLFSMASSVRLDNFVYTRESLIEVRDLLADDGLLSLSFWVGADFVGEHHYRTLTDAFGHPPQVYQLPTGHTLYLIKRDPVTEPLIDNPLVPPIETYALAQNVEPVTDNWPYVYLNGRTIPSTYLIGLLGVILISFLLIRTTLPGFRQFNAHFFFMGAAFFLLETKSITELALLLGSTWIVTAAVIAAILAMIVAANIVVERFKLDDPRPWYALLALALVFNFFVPVGSFLGLPLTQRILLASFAQALPLFFAGLIFAITFSRATSIETALGSNLFGAVLGGLLEYTSLALGIRSLYLIALALYLLSALALYLHQKRGSVALPASTG